MWSNFRSWVMVCSKVGWMMFWLPRSAKRGVSWGTGIESGGVETVEYRDEPGFCGSGEPFFACLLKVEYCLFLVVEGMDLTCFCVCILIESQSLRMRWRRREDRRILGPTGGASKEKVILVEFN